jgi:DNA polymerase III delta subunit
MITIILGPDAALARATARDLAHQRDPDGQNTTTMDGKAVSVHDVLMAAASIGFFSQGRTIVVEDLIARHAKGAGKGGEADWAALFSAVPAETSLILLDASVLTLPAAVKKALPDGAQVVASDPPRGRDLVEWIVRRARAQGGAIDNRTAQLLASTLYPASWSQKGRNPAFDRPPDMDALGNEVDKLVIAAHPGPVTGEHISALVAAGDNDQIFAFIDAASAGNLQRALPELDRLLAAGEDPHKILSQLCGSVELAAVMSEAGRRDPAEVGRELKLSNPARMSAVARTVREQPRGLAPRAARVLRETDRKMKTGELRDPVDALYAALAGIARLRRP